MYIWMYGYYIHIYTYIYIYICIHTYMEIGPRAARQTDSLTHRQVATLLAIAARLPDSAGQMGWAPTCPTVAPRTRVQGFPKRAYTYIHTCIYVCMY